MPTSLPPLDSTREDTAITAFERLFRERGLPLAIRSDNGVPFASPNALFNLSKLSVWWLRLGIAIERIKPGRLLFLRTAFPMFDSVPNGGHDG